MNNEQSISRICWQGEIQAVQCRAWVWRYKTDNRTHHHLGFNLWIKGEAADKVGKFIVAVSDTQHRKIQFRIGDVAEGTAWPCKQAKHEIDGNLNIGLVTAVMLQDLGRHDPV